MNLGVAVLDVTAVPQLRAPLAPPSVVVVPYNPSRSQEDYERHRANTASCLVWRSQGFVLNANPRFEVSIPFTGCCLRDTIHDEGVL